MEQHFKHMAPEASRFYTRCVNEILLNIFAVRAGHYGRYMQEMKDDEDLQEWRECLPLVTAIMAYRMGQI
jgi:hypothetical protein